MLDLNIQHGTLRGDSFTTMINPKAEELQHDELPVQNPPPSYTPIAERGATSAHTAPPPSIAMPVPNVTNTPSRQHEPPSMGRSQQYAPPLAHSQGYPPPNLKPPQPPTPKTAAQIGEEYKASCMLSRSSSQAYNSCTTPCSIGGMRTWKT